MYSFEKWEQVRDEIFEQIKSRLKLDGRAVKQLKVTFDWSREAIPVVIETVEFPPECIER